MINSYWVWEKDKDLP